MGILVVLIVLTAGVIAGDWAIYWLGAASRRLKVLERFLRSERTIRSGEWLDRRLLLVIVVARLFPGPGILFPVFSSIGLLGIGFAGFAVRSAAVAAVYTPVMLYLTLLYGDAMAPLLGWWAWPALLLVSLVGVGGPWARGLRHVVGEWVGLHDEGSTHSGKRP
jgi:membrane protein DedA with SNARE-associated domain